MSSDAQQNASRENGKRSHGAVTPEGQRVCCRNAVKHGLTARTILLPSEDEPSYDACIATVVKTYKPVTDMEKMVIQEVADTTWKLQRVAVYESGLFAKGCMENQYLFGPDIVNPEDRHIIVEAEIAHTYSKTLTNLVMQQDRTQRHLERKIKQFEKLRAEREILELAKRKIAMDSVMGDPNDMRPCHPTVGSVFSIEYLAARVEFERAAKWFEGASNEEKLVIFDRSWGDFKAKVPA